MTPLRIGTCSWKFDSWQGLVYTNTAKPEYLKEYAQHFNTVEIDQWFWSLHGVDTVSLPKPQLVEEYVNAVPEDFRFSVKVPNSITLTHFYRKKKNTPLQVNPHFLSIDLLTKFLEKLEPMRSRLGPLMFQFEYLNKQKMSSQQTFQQQFGEFMAQCPQGYSYSLEIRNPQWLNPSYFTFLKQTNLYHVFLQGYYMPPIFPIYETFVDWINDVAIIRLHGPDRQGIEKKSSGQWNIVIESKDQEIPSVVQILRDLLARNVTVYLNVNNHYEGSAPLTIEKISRILREHGYDVGEPLTKRKQSEPGEQIELL